MAAGGGVTKSAEVVVVGAGVMGLWTAFMLRERGHDVILVDAWGPGHLRATSSDESRVIRCGYGGAGFYTRWAQRSLALWAKWQKRWKEELLFPCGVLWLVTGDPIYAEASLTELERNRISFERLDRRSLERRYPQIDPRGVRWSLFEPESGTILARRACLVVARAFEKAGGSIALAEVRPGPASGRRLTEVVATGVRGTASRRIAAKKFVFACGPWLPGIFPELLRGRIRVTRKELFYFGTPPGDDRFGTSRCPVWLELGTQCYGIPSIEGRGFKVGPDVPGRVVDPTTQDRRPSRKLLGLARACLKRRFPAMADAPVLESRVCQYESTRDENLIFDRHPRFDNVWIVGGGSGHAFKHGPVIGELVADVVGSPGAGSIAAVPPHLRLSHVPSGSHF